MAHQENQDKRSSSRPHNPPDFLTYDKLGNPVMTATPAPTPTVAPSVGFGATAPTLNDAPGIGFGAVAPTFPSSTKSVSGRSKRSGATSYLSSVTPKTIIEAKANKEIADLERETKTKIIEIEAELEIAQFEIKEKQKVVDRIRSVAEPTDEEKEILKCREAEIAELEKQVFVRDVEIKKLKKQQENCKSSILSKMESDITLAGCDDDKNSQYLGSDDEIDKPPNPNTEAPTAPSPPIGDAHQSPPFIPLVSSTPFLNWPEVKSVPEQHPNNSVWQPPMNQGQPKYSPVNTLSPGPSKNFQFSSHHDPASNALNQAFSAPDHRPEFLDFRAPNHGQHMPYAPHHQYSAPNPVPHNSQPSACNPASHQCNFAVSELAAAIKGLATDRLSKGSKADKELPIFDGNYKDWPLFESVYTRTTKDFNMGDSENMQRLRKSLVGAPLARVHHLLPTPSNAPKIMELLKKIYDRPELLLDTMVEEARKMKPVEDKPESLDAFGTTIDALLTNIHNSGMNSYLYDRTLVTELTRKLPERLQIEWMRWRTQNKGQDVNLQIFAEWLEPEVEIARLRFLPAPTPKPEKGKEVKQAKFRSRHVGTTLDKEVEQKSDNHCFNCDRDGHGLHNCREFRKRPPDQRRKVVEDHKLCFRCLGSGHGARICKAKNKCKKDGCGKAHHTLLHMDSQSAPNPSTSRKTAAAPNPPTSNEAPTAPNPTSSEAKTNPVPVPVTSSNQVGHCGSSSPKILKYVPVRVYGPKGSKEVYAFLDDGSHLDMIHTDLANELGIKGREVNVFVGDWEGDEKKKKSMAVKFEVSGIAPNARKFKIEDARVLPLNCTEQSYNYDEIVRRFPQMAAAPIRSQDRVKPMVLIGSRNWRLSFPRAKIEPSAHSEAAVKTWLGWILVGADEIGRRNGCYNISARDEELTHLVRQYLCLDAFGSASDAPIQSREDQKSLSILEATTQKVGERWETGLLWRDREPAMPNSRRMAEKRLWMMEKKADQNPEFAALYTSRFQEYIEKGYLVESPNSSQSSSRKWYLPHFFALHPSKKPRLVFDAAAKVNGKSFNDFMMKGPDLLQQLPAVLIRFRRHKVAITGDIKEMFHQVRLREEDWPSQTILYRGMDREQAPREYQMRVLFFGSACSPCSAIYVRDKNASEFSHLYPDAVRAIHRDNYMDDFHSGSDTEWGAIELFRQVLQINEKGGFPILKWSSSSPAVLAAIPPNLRASGDKAIKVKSDIPQEKTLGMIWRPAEDAFAFKVNLERIPPEVLPGERRPTKREMASFIMSLFDPLGFLMPLKMKGLAIFQDTWKAGIGWDGEATEDIADRFMEWVQELEQINSISIPRCFDMIRSKSSKLELHVFCDASQEAYAAAAYVRSETGGRVTTSLLIGKARVKPLKDLTVPRMELQAALLGVRIAEFVRKAFADDLEFAQVVYWCDSRAVLGWIYSDTGRHGQYINNRIQEIQAKSNPSEWRWVPTALNIADDATRPSKPVRLNSNSRWITGAGFLHDSPSSWPVIPKPIDESDALEEVKASVYATSEKIMRLPLPDENQFSTWWALIKKTASWIRSVRVMHELYIRKANQSSKSSVPDPMRSHSSAPNHKSSHSQVARNITKEDVNYAEFLWANQVQIDSFGAELEDLKSSQRVKKQSRLYRLSPVLLNGLLVLQGRLANSQSPGSVKHPIILAPDHRYTELLIQRVHARFAHQGQETVLAEIRRQYWILDARAAVRRVLSKCQICKNKRSIAPIPPMGQLPECRVAEGKPPFSHTGVDLFGPMEVAMGRRREKRWGVIFTCMTTRASFFDLVPSLSTSDFIDCLVRFNCRRGPAEYMWSDNGTNFKGAVTELRQAVNDLDQESIRTILLENGTEWNFNPPSAPHMGGAWERVIGLAKRILRTILKEQVPREYTLLTVLAEVENILNSRPLTAVSPDPKDPDAITPNHLLKLRCTPGRISQDTFDHVTYRRMWRLAQKLSDDFWKRFRAEYLPTLNQQKKWYQRGQDPNPVREGDIVLVSEDNAPRNEWSKGVVEKAIQGRDGVVRVVQVRLAKPGGHRELTRPIVKVYPLGLNVNDR